MLNINVKKIPLERKTFDRIVGNGENAGNQQFSAFLRVLSIYLDQSIVAW